MDDFKIKIVVLGVVSKLLSTVETDKARIRRKLDVKVFCVKSFSAETFFPLTWVVPEPWDQWTTVTMSNN